MLQILQQRSARWRSKGAQVNEDDPVEAGVTTEDGRSLGELTIEEASALKDMNEDILRVHGLPPGKKAEGVCRLIYENANGINNRMAKNPKLERAQEMIHELSADIMAFNEHRMNMSHHSTVNGFRKLFQGGETELRAVAAHNVHNNICRTQEGGTCLMVYGEMIDYFDSESSGKEESGLGRWVVMTFKGTEGFTMRIICGYSPCYNSRGATSTAYQQQKNYWLTHKKQHICPRTKLREDLIEQLSVWREQGDRLIVCLDANEHIYEKHLGQLLTDTDGLAMREVVGEFTKEPLGATYFRGSKPIDAIWATSDVTVVGACVMPCGYGIGDHRLFIIDFLTSSLIGLSPTKIIRPAARRLNTRIPHVAKAYTERLEQLIIGHRMIERIGAIHESGRSSAWISREMNKVDKEGRDYMLASEKKCRKIRAGCIPFSPEAVRWIRRAQVYRSLLLWKAGRRRNRSNLHRLATRVGIECPRGRLK